VAAKYFTDPSEFRAWLAKHGAARGELLVGFHKRGTGTPSLTWPQSVEVALCYGWIDGKRQRIDEARYTIRFTPRRPTSIWSAINIEKIAQLRAAGLMTEAGERAFALRNESKSRVYSFERAEAATLAPTDERRFRANKAAWAYFQAQPPWYRRTAYHWVISAKREETRDRRLAQLIADSAAQRTIPPLTRPGQKKPA
jgi:uncharacterized protein YdeI (YjbR/CyaY-like superfamily)